MALPLPIASYIYLTIVERKEAEGKRAQWTQRRKKKKKALSLPSYVRSFVVGRYFVRSPTAKLCTFALPMARREGGGGLRERRELWAGRVSWALADRGEGRKEEGEGFVLIQLSKTLQSPTTHVV